MDDDRTLGPFHDPDLEQPSGGIRTDDHEEPVIEFLDPHRVVEGVEDTRTVDAMSACALCDRRFAVHCSKITCGCDGLRRSTSLLTTAGRATSTGCRWRTDGSRLPHRLDPGSPGRRVARSADSPGGTFELAPQSQTALCSCVGPSDSGGIALSDPGQIPKLMQDGGLLPLELLLDWSGQVVFDHVTGPLNAAPVKVA